MSESVVSLDKLISDNNETLNKLEDWIATQKHMPKNIPRNVLIRYFKARNNDFEDIKKLLDDNVKFRIKNKYMFTNRDIESEEFQILLRTIHVARFPKLSKEGYTIDSIRIASTNLSNFNMKGALMMIIMLDDMNALIGPNNNGTIKIYDARGFSFQHFLRVVSSMQSLIHFSQYGSSYTHVQPKQIHFLHCSSFVSKIISMLKPFFTKEIIESIHCHPAGFETLHKFVDKEVLPIEYGGSCGTLEEHMESTLKNLQNNQDFIRNDDNFFLINK